MLHGSLGEWGEIMKFEIGRSYWAGDRSYGAVKVINRTPYYIYVENDCGSRWRMKIRRDRDGTEFVIDSSVPQGWRGAFMYCADDIMKGE